MSGAKVVTTTSRVKPERVGVSPDPDGNRAQRRAWAKLTKGRGKPPKSTSDSPEG